MASSVRKPKKGSASRRKHTNSKLGCLNCKTKKIRCDETLPVCRNCTRGKNERCSYLDLSAPDIDRIRLTHSLRDSQNKLLIQDYRLPTSNNTKSIHSKHPNSNEISLEFKFELTDLPQNIPSIPYPPIQFNYLTVDDFSNEFKVIFDEAPSSSSSSPIEAKSDVKGSMISNGTPLRTSFKVVRAKINIDNQESFAKTTIYNGPKDRAKSFQLFWNLYSSLEGESYLNYVNTALDVLVCLGESIILNSLRQKDSQRDSKLSNTLSKMTKRCLERNRISFIRLAKGIEIYGNSSQLDVMEKFKIGPILGYTSVFLCYITLILRQSQSNFAKLAKERQRVFDLLISFIGEAEFQTWQSSRVLSYNLQYKLLSIGIPSYKPIYLLEVQYNLRSLQHIYKSEIVNCTDNKLREIFNNASRNFTNLLSFIDELLPLAFSNRDEESVFIYSPSVILKLLELWHSIYPVSSMHFKPYIDFNLPEESRFYSDITATVYMYFHAIGASLDSVFPASTYLFDGSFTSLESDFYYERTTMTVQRENKFHKLFQTADLLQRHNYYAMRLLAFFRKRSNYYINNIKWTSPFDEKLKSNRLKSRKVNSFEVHIERFNVTLIRPEHYPSKLPYEKELINRTDFIIPQRLYCRNIETLNFFNSETILQYDYDSRLLLQDYRPEDGKVYENSFQMSINDIREFFEDRKILLSNNPA